MGTAVTGGDADEFYRFTGQHQDPTGLYRMGLRYYNPSQARWTQPDPALSLTQLPFANTYTYVGGNPVNQIDPTGADGYGRVCATGVVWGAGLALIGVATGTAPATLGFAAKAVVGGCGASVGQHFIDHRLQ